MVKKININLGQSMTDKTESVKALCRSIETARKYAKTPQEKLVYENYRLVFSLAKRFQHQGVEFEDLVMEGMVGLTLAASRFDSTRKSAVHNGEDTKFSYYAAHYIIGSMCQAISDYGRIVAVPGKYADTLKRIEKAKARFEQDNTFEAGLDDLAEILDITPGMLKAVLAADDAVVELDSPIAENADESVADTLENNCFPSVEEQMEEAYRKAQAHSFLRRLDPRSREIVCRYNGIGFPKSSYETIAFEMRLSSSRVQKLYLEAINKMREFARK